MKITAVIPVKQLSRVKQRLADVLNEDQRQGLFTAMVKDVLTAVRQTPAIDETLIVTSDPAVADLGRNYGAEILPEPEEPGLIESVTEAGRWLTGRGVDCMLFLPGDIPLVTVEELEIVLNRIKEAGKVLFIIVPASDLGGSNCVACSPPDCMEFGFGVDSFRRHLSIAREKGIEPIVLKLPGIGLDIDTYDDLRELAAVLERKKITSFTHEYLQKTGLV